MKNMVDERFECAAVIFRLVGNVEYNDIDTDYTHEVAEVFAKFSEHPAVEFAKTLRNTSGIGYNKVFKFTVHIEKKDNKFIFIENTDSLFDGGWNEENSKKFLELFNDFYVDTNYAEFYDSHISLFEKTTQKFIDETYGKIDFEWFGKYVNPSNLRCIYSLSSGNYAATVNGKIIYCCVIGNGGAMIHEYCHSFANLLAEKWYKDNTEFKKWVDESINTEKMPYYNNSTAMKNEYVTRAYQILYEVQHGADLYEWLSRERDFQFKDSFKYIEQVYNMILELENFNTN